MTYGVLIAILILLRTAATIWAVECGSGDTIPDPTKPSILIQFILSSRNGTAPLIGSIRVNWSLPIAFLDSDGTVRDPMGFIGDTSGNLPEIRYMLQYEEMFKTFRMKKNNDYTSEIVVQVACHFVPCLRKCQVVYDINDDVKSSAHIYWDGTQPSIRVNDPDRVVSTGDMVHAGRYMVLGTCTDLLRNHARKIYDRWAAVFRRIRNAASYYSSSLVFQYSPEYPRDIFCQLRTASPLPFVLVIEGPGMPPIVSEEARTERECTVATIANLVPPDGYDVNQLVCTVMSPLGGNSSVKGPKRVYPETFQGGIVKEYRPGVHYYYPEPKNWNTFVCMMIVGAIITIVFATLIKVIAYILVGAPTGMSGKSNMITKPSLTTGNGVCESCRKKFQ